LVLPISRFGYLKIEERKTVIYYVRHKAQADVVGQEIEYTKQDAQENSGHTLRQVEVDNPKSQGANQHRPERTHMIAVNKRAQNAFAKNEFFDKWSNYGKQQDAKHV
jgi:hypothetical protein